MCCKKLEENNYELKTTVMEESKYDDEVVNEEKDDNNNLIFMNSMGKDVDIGENIQIVSDEINTTNEDNDDIGLINMIKNVMLEDKIKDKDTIQHLKEEINFLQKEILERNNNIKSLLELIKLSHENNKNINKPIETTPKYVCSNIAKCDTLIDHNSTVNRYLISDDDNSDENKNSTLKNLNGDMILRDISSDISNSLDSSSDTKTMMFLTSHPPILTLKNYT